MPGPGEKFGGSGGPGLIGLTAKEHEDHKNPPAETGWKKKLHTELTELLNQVDALKNEKSREAYIGVLNKAMFAVDGVIGLSDALGSIEAANGSGIREDYQKNLEHFLQETKTFIELAVAEEKAKEGK